MLFCLGLLICLIAGCTAKKEEADEKSHAEEIMIPVIFRVSPTTGNKDNLELVREFNKKYQGRYQVDVEWVMETEEEYRQNLITQNVTDSLPAIITDLRMMPSFYQMMITDGRLENLAPYLEEDEEWKAMIEPAVWKGCKESESEIYLAPISTVAFSCSGIFWNQELFEEAGIEKFPETWEEFWECCDILKEHRITPFTLHTDGTAWAPMLLATTELADSEEGAEFMEQLFPESYQNVCGIEMAETLIRLFGYSAEGGLHSDFDKSMADFMAGKAAMVPNGYWTIEQIPDECRAWIRFSKFPGNKLVSSPETFGWSVVSNYSDEVKKGAIEFLKFRTCFNQREKEQLIEMKGTVGSLALSDYIDAFASGPQIVPNYQVKWNSILQKETLGEYLPLLVTGEITPEEFTRMEDESIRQYEEEK